MLQTRLAPFLDQLQCFNDSTNIPDYSAVHETEMLFTEHNLETKLGEDEANQGN